jgi:hypothetical protein
VGVRRRVLIYQAGAALLAALGLVFVGAAFLSGGGIAVIIIGLPLLLLAAAMLRGWRWGRLVGVAAGVTYALAIGFVATTPWRGLSPPPGQPPAPLEPDLVVLTAAFALASVLVAIGKRANAAG